MNYEEALENFKMTKNINVFEDLCSRIILENPDLFGEEDVVRINNHSPRAKRGSILSKLDKDRKLFLKIAEKALKQKMPKLDYMREVLSMLREYVKVGEIEKKKFGEVMTPIDLVEEMLHKLPKNVWTNPNLKWLDPCNGSGPFLSYVIKNLMFALRNWEPDDEKRYKHIIENMVYSCELQAKNQFIYLCLVDPWDCYSCNVYTGSFLDGGFDKHMKEVWGLDKFDITIGNPPYQSSSDDIRGSKSIYNLFVDKSTKLSDMVLMVTPSRWFLNKNMEDFRNDMLSKYGLKLLNECDNDVFPNVEIKGGVSYFLIEKNYEGFINFNGSQIKFEHGIIDVNIGNLIKYVPENSLFVSEIFNSGSYFGIETNDCRLKNNDNLIKCYVSKMNGLIKFIDPSQVPNKTNLHKYKLLVPSASGSKDDIGCLGRLEIASPNEICSSSFTHFGFETEYECLSMKSYLSTKFIKFLIKVKKPTQRVKKDVFSLVPIVPFDRIWTDESVLRYFNVTLDDQEYLNKII